LAGALYLRLHGSGRAVESSQALCRVARKSHPTHLAVGWDVNPDPSLLVDHRLHRFLDQPICTRTRQHLALISPFDQVQDLARTWQAARMGGQNAFGTALLGPTSSP
jgi:hypothetical protein